MIIPLSNHIITQGFGENPDDYSKFGYPGHNGIDLITLDYPPVVYASNTGRCLKVGWEEEGYGKYIVLQHASFQTLYAHLDQVLIRPGDRVIEGEPIAIMGNTGNSTGPHLHFGIKDPVDFGDGYKGYLNPMLALATAKQPTIQNIDLIISVPVPVVGKIPTTGKIKKPTTAKGGKRTVYPRMKYF